jgi:uncharacterized protein YjbI with pentapeptide repeats/serine/threonine protein kinase
VQDDPLTSAALTERDIDRLIRERSETQCLALVSNPNVTEQHLKLLATSPMESVRRSAFGELGMRGILSVGDPSDRDLVGQGAFGDVYRMLQPDGSYIARKIFYYRGAARHLGVARERFLRGAYIMRDTLAGHPRIVPVFDIDESDPEHPSYTMEYVPGGDLAVLIGEPAEAAKLLDFTPEDDGSVPLAIRLGILVDLCDAVSAAHAKDVVHRDIKPRNVLLYRDNDRIRAKITDFDTAFGPGLSEITASSDIFATLFSPPWLRLGHEGGRLVTSLPTQDKRTLHTDHFGVAATTFFCLTGAHPHPGKFCDDKLDEEMVRAAGTLVERPLDELIGVIREALAVSEPEEVRVLTGNIRHHLAAFDREAMSQQRVGGVFVYATPDDQTRIRIDKEMLGILGHSLAPQDSDPAGLETLAVVPAASIEDFDATLRQNPGVRLIWLGGHGDSSFAFEDDTTTLEADVERLEVVLKPHVPPSGQLQCVVLNCCNSADLAAELADRLRLSFVIGVEGLLADKAAIAFSAGMVDGLVAGRGYAGALELGVAAVGAAVGPEAASRYVSHQRSYPALGSSDVKALLAVVRGDTATPRQKRDALASLIKLEVDKIESARLQGCDISDLDLTRLQLPDLRIDHGTAVNTGMSGAALMGVNAEEVTFTRANLNGATAERGNFRAARLTDANANQLFAPNACFIDANWFGVTATACQCEGSAFTGANLARANLSRGTFVGCQFDKASLVGAILSRAVCREADFGEADVRFTDFSRTHLGGADLRRVKNLGEAKLFKIYHDEATQWPDGFEPPESAVETWTAS